MVERAQSLGFVPRPVVGIALALIAYALFTCMDTVVKLLGGRYHVLEVMFLNSVFGLLTTCAIGAFEGSLRRVRAGRAHLHFGRWTISVIGTACTFYAYTRLPLADVYAILFAAPLLITALSVPLLGEQVGWRRWTAVLVGFLGVLVMLRPGGDALDPVALIALVGAFGHALNMLIVRRMGRLEPPVTFGIFGNLYTVLVFAFLMPFVWIWPTPGDLLLAAAAGTVAGVGFWLLVSAFRHAPVAVMAPFQYSQMPYGLLVGWLLFETSPDPTMLTGAAIVIGSGIYILHREARLQADLASPSSRPPLWRRRAGRRPA